NWSAWRCALSAFVRFSDMWTVSHRPECHARGSGFQTAPAIRLASQTCESLTGTQPERRLVPHRKTNSITRLRRGSLHTERVNLQLFLAEGVRYEKANARFCDARLADVHTRRGSIRHESERSESG